jgi:hypothetical protein
MLRTSRVHPKLSADHVLEGVHDFNKNPWAPPATRATILNPPNMQGLWDQRALNAWMIGPAWDHYRALTFYVQSTGGTRVSGNYQLYPEHCDVPKETVMDETLRVAKDLLSAIKKLQGQESILPGRHTKALQTLSEIFNDKTINLETTEQRVLQTSNSPTRPENIRRTPRVHSRVTRNNTPGLIPAPTVTASSEGGNISKAPPQLAT